MRPVFLSNRNFEAHYNVPCTLRAFALIQAAMPEVSLIVVGDGPAREEIEHLAAQLCLKNVEFMGKVSPEDMPSVYDRADVYLNSPSIDNMPNSIIEAFACGLPVVSTNAGGIPYIVEDGKTGLLADVNEHKSLAAAALRLFSEAGQAERLIAASQDEVRKYTWQNVRCEWLRTYAGLAGRTCSTSAETL
jgi:glycosyltransferase involved in cell wall biosynthesis